MPPSPHLHWLDVDRLGEALHAAHPDTDPLTLRFTQLRGLVEALPNFREQPGHPVNEKILEAIQMAWHDEREDAADENEDA
ncbi:MAG TPA: Fe-S cluster assembly protein IscX [Phycisphaerales bacterium]|nr:Fe-S cluster assembly protein IscX [Phycisphaerales bacterium]